MNLNTDFWHELFLRPGGELILLVAVGALVHW